MNPRRLKLVLALFWLVPGLILLVADTFAGEPLAALPVGGRSVPLAWLFLVFAVFNGLRWWAAGTTKKARDIRSVVRKQPPPANDRTITDPAFRFGEPND